jgi:ribose-phosphate pyrophosphokinase
MILGKDEFSAGLAKELNTEFAKIESKVFPNGESYVRIPKIKGDVVYVARGSLPFNPDKLMLETILVLEKLKEMNLKVICLMPYQPYARQDKVFLEGEAHSLKYLRDLITERCDLLVNVSAHDFRREGWISKKAYNIDPVNSAMEFLKTEKIDNPVVLAPDMTENDNVRKISEALKCESLAIHKSRDRVTGKIETKADLPDLKGKTAIVYDDIVTSGGTMISALKAVKKAGANKAISMCIHLDKKDPVEDIKNLGEFYPSDTIDTGIPGFSVIPQIAETLENL